MSLCSENQQLKWKINRMQAHYEHKMGVSGVIVDKLTHAKVIEEH